MRDSASVNRETYSCGKCGRPIGDHNKFLHAGMCDECFFETYFPDEIEIFEKDAGNLAKRCAENEIENTFFLRYVKSDKLNVKRFNHIVNQVEKKIDCTTCGNCCKVLSPDLYEEDIRRISNILKISEKKFEDMYLNCENEGLFQFKKSPCPFLEQNKCTIYPVRPEECKQYPNLDKNIANRCIQFFSNAELCPIVYNVLENTKILFFEEIYDNQFDYLFGKNHQ